MVEHTSKLLNNIDNKNKIDHQFTIKHKKYLYSQSTNTILVSTALLYLASLNVHNSYKNYIFFDFFKYRIKELKNTSFSCLALKQYII